MSSNDWVWPVIITYIFLYHVQRYLIFVLICIFSMSNKYLTYSMHSCLILFFFVEVFVHIFNHFLFCMMISYYCFDNKIISILLLHTLLIQTIYRDVIFRYFFPVCSMSNYSFKKTLLWAKVLKFWRNLIYQYFFLNSDISFLN